MTREDGLVAAGHSVGPGRWLGVLDELMTWTGSRFSRVEPWRRARAFVLGLARVAPLPGSLATTRTGLTPAGDDELLIRS